MRKFDELMRSGMQRNKLQAEKSADIKAAEQELLPCKEFLTEAESELRDPNYTDGQQKRPVVIGKKLVAAASEKLTQCEQLGLFTSFPVSDKNAIPTLIARLPIFLPSTANEQKTLLDDDLAYCFQTPFGRGRRFGPPVTIDDEDVLFALMHLSERRLIGKGSKLPIPIPEDEWVSDDEGNLTVQIAIATILQINNEIGLTKGGKNYNKTLASIRRLGQIGIELETRKSELYLGKSWAGQTIRLVDLKWRSYEENGLIFAQFSPIMVKWLKEQATYFNWKIRKALKTPNAKALHRFLSTQGYHYKQEIEYIADVIGWRGKRERLRPRMEEVLVELRDVHDWCNYEITGTGRSTPFILEFWRNRK